MPLAEDAKERERERKRAREKDPRQSLGILGCLPLLGTTEGEGVVPA
jgi:Flp pilus assembly protein TadB